MKYLFLIPLTFVLPALLPASAPAQVLPDNPQPVKSQVNGWNRVRDLRRGDEIYIQTAGGMHQACRFGGATEDYLFCDPLFDGASEGGYRLDRAEVEKIRIGHEERNRCIIVAAATGAGFLATYAGHGSDTQDLRVVYSFIGAGMGTLFGSLVARPIAHFIPASSFYRQPAQDRKARSSFSSLQPVPIPARPAP